MKRVRAVAFYLPQFHETNENNEFWGPGFTEWDHVRSAVAQFPGHAQPLRPERFGYYDLRDSSVVERQIELAKRHGVEAFCYYHYWFEGRRLLHHPLDARLGAADLGHSFCLCWANESWTRRWDGRDQDVLVEQRYSEADDLEHARFLAEPFSNELYLRIHGRPLFLIYRPSGLPSPERTIALWRREFARLGVEPPFLAAVESAESDKRDWREVGFDVNVEFQPDWWGLGSRIPIAKAFAGMSTGEAERLERSGFLYFRYEETVRRMLARERPSWPRIPCVTPRWDNTPRRGPSGLVIDGSTPELFESWCRAVSHQLHPDPELDFVFVNAWNEWGEGAMLEPERVWGEAYLTALERALLADDADRP